MPLHPPGEYPPLFYTRLDWAALVLEEEKEEREKKIQEIFVQEGGVGG